MTKRISISIDEGQAAVLRSVKGIGTKDAERVKNILIAFLSEKGYIDKFNKVRVKKG